ncbi:MAG: hypothetical protein ACI9FN_002921 [Saprospiraceae bacterium]
MLERPLRYSNYKKNRIVIHILLWGGAWILLILFWARGTIEPMFLFYRTMLILLGIAIVLIANLKILLPQFYFKKKIGIYVFTSFLLFILMIWLLNNDFFLFRALFDKYADYQSSILENEIARRAARPSNSIKWVRYILPLFLSFGEVP